jgi:hypothetical protein
MCAYLKKVDEEKRTISMHAQNISRWTEEIEALKSQYLVRDPVVDLGLRAERLRSELERLENTLQKLVPGPGTKTDELEEGEIREGLGPAKVNPSEVGVFTSLTPRKETEGLPKAPQARPAIPCLTKAQPAQTPGLGLGGDCNQRGSNSSLQSTENADSNRSQEYGACPGSNADS